MNDRQRVGKRGEDEACRYLHNIGHTILARGWRHSHQEVDIVSVDKTGIHLVEVKSRTAPVVADPEVNITPAKQRSLVKAGGALLRDPMVKALHLSEPELLFDVITIIFDGNDVLVEYYPQAFLPMYF